MSIELLQKRFGAMGARVTYTGPLWGGVPAVDVPRGRGTFVLGFPGGYPVGVEVVDVRRQHLLLLVRDVDVKSKFLCGHDERDWFVAAVPEAARGVTGVDAAMRALRPQLVEESRKWIRQGEWFFVPAPTLDPPALHILRKEPLTRGWGSTPHVLEEAYRRGGELVYVNRAGHAMSAARWVKRSAEKQRRDPRQPMTRDPELYARGAVRHPDHATIVLRGWHRVVMNTEQSARAMQHVAFLD